MQSNAGREKTIKSRRRREWDEGEKSRRGKKSLREKRGGRQREDEFSQDN